VQTQIKKYDYYGRAYLGFKLIQNSKNREVASIPLLRAGQIRSLNELNSLLDVCNWNKKKRNFYVSLAKISEIPNFTWNMSKRSNFTREWFREEFVKSIYEYDLYFDFII